MRSWTSERLILRQLGSESVDEVADYSARSREFQQPWEPIRPQEWWERSAIAERLDAEVLEADADRQLVLYLHMKERPHRVIGRLAINNIIRGALQGCAVGYGLEPDAVGNGYMTEALGRAVEIAFRDLNLHRVEVNAIARNERSIAVAQRCGFEREGVSRAFLYIRGTWEDHVRYVRINDEWEER